MTIKLREELRTKMIHSLSEVINMLKLRYSLTALLLGTLTLLATPIYALTSNGQPELTIYNKQGSSPVTDIAYWLTDMSGTIDCRGSESQGIPISAGAYQTVLLKSDMSPKCQAVNQYVLHVHGNMIKSWSYTAYPISGSVCVATHNYTSWPFTTIDLKCS